MTDYKLANDWSLDPKTFKAVVLAFNHPEAAAELLTGLTVDSYADLVEEYADEGWKINIQDQHPLIRTFYHALNPNLIEV